jgi:hypothetical protein
MSHLAASGWYGDPGHEHEVRYWDGARWTASVSDHGTVTQDELPGGRIGPPGGGDRLALGALALLVFGGAAALVASVFWGQWVKTSSLLEAEERVRGWTALWRDLPMAVIAWSVPIAAMVLAVRACRRGSASLGRAVIWASGGVLFVVSVSLIGGEVESAMTGSHPELKWMLLPVSIAISAGGTYLALRAARRPPA